MLNTLESWSKKCSGNPEQIGTMSYYPFVPTPLTIVGTKRIGPTGYGRASRTWIRSHCTNFGTNCRLKASFCNGITKVANGLRVRFNVPDRFSRTFPERLAWIGACSVRLERPGECGIELLRAAGSQARYRDYAG
jgi:hypothetical protein